MNPAGELEYLRDWHDRAPGYMAAAAEQGQPRAVLSLALAADAERDAFPRSDEDLGPWAWSSTLAQAQAADASTAYRYYFLARLLANDVQSTWVSAALARLGTELTPAQIAEAQQWAQAAAQRAAATPR